MNVIYGASFIGKIVLDTCISQGINIDYFCDEKSTKIGQIINNVEVVHPDKLDKTITNFIIAVINIKDVLYKLGNCKWESCVPYLNDFTTNDIFLQSVIDMCIFTHKAHNQSDRLLLSNVDLVITERCSLKCKDCANLMQYYKHPQNIDINLLFKSIDKICELSDEIQEFRIIGGEIFMNKEHGKIIQKVATKTNINNIMIFSNGSLDIPIGQLEAYDDHRIIFSITDYGPALSKHIKQLIKNLEKLNIKYYTATFTDWYDCAKILSKTNKNVFSECCANGLLTILYDRIYKCPFSAHATNLNLIPEYPTDYLKIFDITKEEFKKYINDVVPEACYHCQGRLNTLPTIKAAIQL